MSSCEYCKQMALTCNKKMNFTTLCTDIQLTVLGYCMAAAQIQQELALELHDVL